MRGFKQTIALMALTASMVAPQALAQDTLFESLRRPTGWSDYLFVSLRMPTEALVALAREARAANIPMLVAGDLENGPKGRAATIEKVRFVNSACCGNAGGAHWLIYPQMFDRYKVTQVPAFVLTKGGGSKPADFVKVAGDMSLADALKLIAQQSHNVEMTAHAEKIYNSAFSSY